MIVTEAKTVANQVIDQTRTALASLAAAPAPVAVAAGRVTATSTASSGSAAGSVALLVGPAKLEFETAVEAAAREALHASGVGLDDAGDDTADRIDVLAGGVGQLCDLAVTQFYALSDKQRQAIAVSQGGVAKWYRQQIQSQFARYQGDGSADAQAAHRAVADQVAALVKELDKVAADGAKKVAATGAAGRASMDTQVGQVLAAVHNVCTTAVNEFRSTVVPAYEAAHEAGTVAVLDFVAKLEVAKQHAMGPATPVLVPDTPSGARWPDDDGPYGSTPGDPKPGEHLMLAPGLLDPYGFEPHDTVGAWATIGALSKQLVDLNAGVAGWFEADVLGVIDRSNPLAAFFPAGAVVKAEFHTVREWLDSNYKSSCTDLVAALNRRLAYLDDAEQAQNEVIEDRRDYLADFVEAFSGLENHGPGAGRSTANMESFQHAVDADPEIGWAHLKLDKIAEERAQIEKMIADASGFGWHEAAIVAEGVGMVAASVNPVGWPALTAAAVAAVAHYQDGNNVGAVLAVAGAAVGVASLARQSKAAAQALTAGDDILDTARPISGAVDDFGDDILDNVNGGTVQPAAPVLHAFDADNVRDILRGLSPGRNKGVWTVESTDELDDVFEGMTAGGRRVVGSSYPGRVVEIADGTRISIRPGSKSGGPTVDIDYPNGGKAKVHVDPWP